MKYKLLYLKGEGEEFDTPYGFREVKGIEQYNNARLRDKAVFRIDLFSALSDWFSADILSKYRNLLYKVISGKVRNKEIISEIFILLYLEDVKFRRYLGEIVYFAPPYQESSLYVIALNTIHKRLEQRKNFLLHELQYHGIKVIEESECYIYCSVADRSIEVKLPRGFRGEVVSHAKIWKGGFSEY